MPLLFYSEPDLCQHVLLNKNVVFTSHRVAILYFSFLARAGDGGESGALQDMSKRERERETGLVGGKFELERVLVSCLYVHAARIGGRREYSFA